MRRNLEWANDLKWERLDYIWVDVPEMQAKALEPVFEMVNDASVCYIPQNEGVAKVTVCDLEEEGKYLVILAMYSPLVIKAGNNTKITGYSYAPTFTVAERNKPLRCVRIAETMAAYDSNYIKRINENTYNAMAYALQRIEARVAGE